MKIISLSVIFSQFFCNYSYSQQVIPLYSDSIPNIIAGSKVDTPILTVYLPAKNNSNGKAVIIFPGGAYSFLASKEEGHIPAKAFADSGFVAFVVKYRLPANNVMRDKTIGPLQDAQQAMLLVKSRSKEWGVDPNSVGIVGYSAGGHIASTLGTHFTASQTHIANPSAISLRPKFMILVYPVITMEKGITHMGSRINLLGDKASDELVKSYSAEQNVDWITPPTYITHTSDDGVVSVDNSIYFYKSLAKEKIKTELHIYPEGNHGFTQRLPVQQWLSPMLSFIRSLN